MSENTKELKMIGVDVAKAKLDIALDDKTVITINNDEDDFKKLLNKLPIIEGICFVMEASGGYEKKFANFLLAILRTVLKRHNPEVTKLLIR